MKILKINTEVAVPDGGICNFYDPHMNISKQLCRFCIKDRGGYRCALFYNSGLSSQGIMVNKCSFCLDEEPVESSRPEEPQVDVKQLASSILKEYTQAYKQYRGQGLPESMAGPQAVKFVKGMFK